MKAPSALLNTRALTQAALAGLLKPALVDVNMVNAPIIAKERGIKVSETRRDRQGVYEGFIKITVTLADGTTRRVAGTVFSDGRPRLIQIKDINWTRSSRRTCSMSSTRTSLASSASWARSLGEAKVNIAAFALGRSAPGADAIALVEVDGGIDEKVLGTIRKLPLVKQANALSF